MLACDSCDFEFVGQERIYMYLVVVKNKCFSRAHHNEANALQEGARQIGESLFFPLLVAFVLLYSPKYSKFNCLIY